MAKKELQAIGGVMSKEKLCELCGDPMPENEPFKYHGYSGPCPKPMIKNDAALTRKLHEDFNDRFNASLGAHLMGPSTSEPDSDNRKTLSLDGILEAAAFLQDLPTCYNEWIVVNGGPLAKKPCLILPEEMFREMVKDKKND